MKKSVSQAIRFLQYLKGGRLKDIKPIFYTEVAKVVGSHPRGVRCALGHIQNACGKMNIPPVQCSVVKMNGMVPGDGYDYEKFGYNVALLKKVREYNFDFDAICEFIKKEAQIH